MYNCSLLVITLFGVRRSLLCLFWRGGAVGRRVSSANRKRMQWCPAWLFSSFTFSSRWEMQLPIHSPRSLCLLTSFSSSVDCCFQGVLAGYSLSTLYVVSLAQDDESLLEDLQPLASESRSVCCHPSPLSSLSLLPL